MTLHLKNVIHNPYDFDYDKEHILTSDQSQYYASKCITGINPLMTCCSNAKT